MDENHCKSPGSRTRTQIFSLFELRLLCENAVKDTSKVVRRSPMHRAYRFFKVNKFQTPGSFCVTLKAVMLQVKQRKDTFSNCAVGTDYWLLMLSYCCTVKKPKCRLKFIFRNIKSACFGACYTVENYRVARGLEST